MPLSKPVFFGERARSAGTAVGCSRSSWGALAGLALTAISVITLAAQ
jgi:hypothetical protein